MATIANPRRHRRRPRLRLTYANVVATSALLIAVGATAGPPTVSWAASKLSPNSVTSQTIKNRTIKAVDIAKGAIGGNEIKNGSLGGGDIANRSIGGIDIARGSIGGTEIAKNSIAGDRLVPNSVSGDRLAPNSVGSHQIANNSLTGADISNGAISNDKVSNDSLGFEKFSRGAKDGLSRYWAGGKVSSGSQLTGYGAAAFHVAQLPVGKVDARAVSFTFPAEIGGFKGLSGEGAHCAGSYEVPASEPGWICYYQKDDGNVENNVGTAEPLSPTDRGFSIKYIPPAGLTAGEWTFAEFSWAYTAP